MSASDRSIHKIFYPKQSITYDQEIWLRVGFEVF